MPTPPRRVFAAPIAPGLGPVQDRLDAAAHAACGLWLRRPNGLEDLHDQSDIDLLHRQSAEDRTCIGLERVAPLVSMLLAAPARLVRGDVAFRRFVEGHRPRGL